MEIDEEYLEYAGQASLALLAISAAYFFDPGRPATYGSLLLIPMLYGYTTYISRDSFRPASLLSLVTLIFTPISTLMGFIAVFVPVSNVLISFFASGTGFKNYSNATLLPMLFTGLILGGIAFGAAQSQPEIRQGIVDSFEQGVSKQTEIMVEQANLDQIQQETSREIARTTSESTVTLTRGYVLNNTDFSRQDDQELDQAFQDAQEQIPDRLADRAGERSGSVDISESASRAASNFIEANLGIIILIAALTFYMINPLISILTAISALAFQKLDERL